MREKMTDLLLMYDILGPLSSSFVVVVVGGGGIRNWRQMLLSRQLST